jgi:hypothetical protein
MSQQGAPSQSSLSSQQQQPGMAPLPPLLHPQKLQEIIVTTAGHAERLDGPVEMVTRASFGGLSFMHAMALYAPT